MQISIFLSLLLCLAINVFAHNIHIEEICGLPAITPHGTAGKFDHIENAVPHSYPWTVFFCGKDENDPNRCWDDLTYEFPLQAALIGHRWVLTTFLPVYEKYIPDLLLAVMGVHNWREWDKPGIVLSNISKVHFFKRNMQFFWEVALYEPISYTPFISPICLPLWDRDLENETIHQGLPATIVGWNWISDEQVPTPKFDQLNQMHARTIYGKKHIHEKHIFIWSNSAESRRDQNFHSGSQLLRQTSNGQWYIYGLMMFDLFMHYTQQEAKFYSLPQFCAWISKVTEYEVICI